MIKIYLPYEYKLRFDLVCTKYKQIYQLQWTSAHLKSLESSYNKIKGESSGSNMATEGKKGVQVTLH